MLLLFDCGSLAVGGESKNHDKEDVVGWRRNCVFSLAQ